MTEIVSGAALPNLPRELTSLPDEVQAVPAPPTPALADPYSIRVVDPDTDAEVISEWMNRPHLAEAWEYDWPPEPWRNYLRTQLAGTYRITATVWPGGSANSRGVNSWASTIWPTAGWRSTPCTGPERLSPGC